MMRTFGRAVRSLGKLEPFRSDLKVIRAFGCRHGSFGEMDGRKRMLSEQCRLHAIVRWNFAHPEAPVRYAVRGRYRDAVAGLQVHAQAIIREAIRPAQAYAPG